jgi:hypothetical protein
MVLRQLRLRQAVQYHLDVTVLHPVEPECEVPQYRLDVGVLHLVEPECEVLQHRLDDGVLHPVNIEPEKLAKRGRECRRAVREHSEKF